MHTYIYVYIHIFILTLFVYCCSSKSHAGILKGVEAVSAVEQHICMYVCISTVICIYICMPVGCVQQRSAASGQMFLLPVDRPCARALSPTI